ncbi:MAG: hypothetical protein EAZ85_02640 [Bacteroidetes bacterium]|nr:MAG: hypothetical protein EAZ85_02640 [Bacteroidota bacterium]TAG90246.1 MAG: hypothetical protein EAZ20_04855 [Bacteroidota bacterium]
MKRFLFFITYILSFPLVAQRNDRYYPNQPDMDLPSWEVFQTDLGIAVGCFVAFWIIYKIATYLGKLYGEKNIAVRILTVLCIIPIMAGVISLLKAILPLIGHLNNVIMSAKMLIVGIVILVVLGALIFSGIQQFFNKK